MGNPFNYDNTMKAFPWIKAPWLLLGIFCLATLTISCDPEEEEEEEEEVDPDFTSITEQGIDFTLSWEAGDTDSASIANVDMDMYLYMGNSIIQQSVNTDSFEMVDLDSVIPNGSYNVRLEYYKGEVDANYTIDIDARESDQDHTVTGTATPADLKRLQIIFRLQRTDSLWAFYLND